MYQHLRRNVPPPLNTPDLTHITTITNQRYTVKTCAGFAACCNTFVVLPLKLYNQTCKDPCVGFTIYRNESSIVSSLARPHATNASHSRLVIFIPHVVMSIILFAHFATFCYLAFPPVCFLWLIDLPLCCLMSPPFLFHAL